MNFSFSWIQTKHFVQHQSVVTFFHCSAHPVGKIQSFWINQRSGISLEGERFPHTDFTKGSGWSNRNRLGHLCELCVICGYSIDIRKSTFFSFFRRPNIEIVTTPVECSRRFQRFCHFRRQFNLKAIKVYIIICHVSTQTPRCA